VRLDLRALIEQGKLRAVTLRVLHVDTERGWRGGERQALWLARELNRRGYGSIVAARRGEPLSARAAEAGLSVVDCSPFSEIDPRAAWQLRRAIHHHRIDVVHAHTAHAVAVAGLGTLGTSVPLVISRRVDFRLRANAGTRWKYGRASAVIAISHAVARVLAASGIAADRIVVVPDGVDVGRLVRRAAAETLASLGVSGDGPLIVQVAQLVGHKDPLNFVRAMVRVRELVPGVHGLLVGDGPLRPDVEREIRTLGLEANVHLAGYRTDADSLLAAADVACLSSREEGMGSVLLDALAFGLPVAATRAGGIPEVIVDGQCGLLADVENPVALGDAIARLIRDDSLRARVRANAKPRANEFSVERMTDRTIAVYEGVLASRDGRSRTAATSAFNSSSLTDAP
jgi:glycosyltransferase involved in cell wall biosynthesis